MDSIGSYEVRPFLKTRKATIDTLDLGSKKHYIPILFEADITKALQRRQELKDSSGEGLSFTGWVVKCVAEAVSEHKEVHAIRRGKTALIVFHDVDVSIMIEREVVGVGPSEKLPMPYVVRRANEKSVAEIHGEIRAAQSRTLQAGEAILGTARLGHLTNLFFSLPKFIRDFLLWRRLATNPFFAKKAMGTVSVSAIGMFGRGPGSIWAISVGIHPLVVVLGGTTRKPAAIGDSIEIRDFLSLTVMFDHDVIDGAPMARFIETLQDLLESGFGVCDEL